MSRSSKNGSYAELLSLAGTVRQFLLPYWHEWHRTWGPPAPNTASQWTCVRSSLLILRALLAMDMPAQIRSGRPSEGESDKDDAEVGLLTLQGWVSHAWVEASGLIVDITADQFGHAPIVVTSVDDPTYRPGLVTAYQITPSANAQRAVDALWNTWRSHAGVLTPAAASTSAGLSD